MQQLCIEKLTLNSLGDIVIPEPLIVIGPYLGLDLEFKLTASAQAQLLFGGALDWPNLNGKIDFLNTENSGASGFEPDITEKFEVTGQLSVSAGVGLPVSLGVGKSSRTIVKVFQILLTHPHTDIDVQDGWWKGGLAIRDTYSVNANASISVSYQNDNYFNATTGNITALDGNGWNINSDDGCYGVDWMIWLQRDLDLVAFVGDTDPWKWQIEPIWYHVFAQGCFGYLKPFCFEQVRPSPLVGDDVQCNVPRQAIMEGHELGDSQHYLNITICARECMKLQKCGGFSWNEDITMCQLYDTGVANLTANWGTGISVYDRNCWQTKDCPYSPDISNATSSDPVSQRRGIENQGLTETNFHYLKFAS